MQEFLADLSTAYWWLSVVVVGLIINVAATYVRPLLDRTGSAASTHWRAASEGRQRSFDTAVAKVKADKELQLEFATGVPLQRAPRSRVPGRSDGVHGGDAPQ